MLQWLGGIGIIVIAIAIFPILKIGGMQLFQTEFSSKRGKGFTKNYKNCWGYWINLYPLTILLLFLYSSGLDIFDSLAHGMTIIATGGFSTKNMSIGFLIPYTQEMVTIIFMMISSLPFILIFHCFRNNLLDLFKNSQVQFFLIFVFFFYYFNSYILANKILRGDYLQALRISSFAVVSIATGSGFSTYDFSTWGTFTTLLFYS